MSYYISKFIDQVAWVLILFLMEYALWDHSVRLKYTSPQKVLILFLMEYALWDMKEKYFIVSGGES